MKRPGPQSLGTIFLIPTLLAVASTIGLIAALIGDGIYDGLSWLGLGLPVAAVLYAWTRRG